ncbi:MAG: sulfotransferase [Deltaproteobacteria bacterium]|nr:sulfotransferase [Deltaproteobacteria bacterium]
MDTSFITIVSGLPRSGTSMMMQVIEAGGVPVLCDHIRSQDDDNPKGYYEFELVKKTKIDPSWVPGACGKVVKVIYSLLNDLPSEYNYRVVFMERSLAEVLASQKKMLERRGQKGGGVPDEKMAALFRSQLATFEHWVRNQKNFSMLRVGYADMIADPVAAVDRVNKFLGGTLDREAMIRAVDPDLYRNRRSSAACS